MKRIGVRYDNLFLTSFPYSMGIHQKPTDGELTTGVGLSLTQKIVEIHDGVISVESEEQKGTTFIVKFPLIS